MRLIIGLAISVCLAGQTAPSFDVASMKSTVYQVSTAGRSSVGVVSPGRLVASNANLSECIREAWGLQEFQLIAPDWAQSKAFNYDIEAKAAPETPKAEMLLMLRTLLQERLHLVVKEESRVVPVYKLTVAKSGLKLPPSKPDAKTGMSNSSSFTTHIVSERATLARLAVALGSRLSRPVIDETGLSGEFAIDVEWDNDQVGANAVRALQDIGLKLESGHAPFRVIVVQSADKVPDAN